MLINIAFHYTHNMADAEDIAQEAFVRLFTKRKELDMSNQIAIKSWLIRVTINLSKDLLRSAWKRKTESMIENAVIVDSAKEDTMLVAVLNLPAKYRDVVYLHYYEGYKFNEIARLLHIKEKTIHTWHSRAKQMLRDKLTEERI